MVDSVKPFLMFEGDSPIKQAFGLAPAFSLFVTCSSKDELRRLAAALAEGGTVYMPIGRRPFRHQLAIEPRGRSGLT